MHSRCCLDYETYKWLLQTINTQFLYDGLRGNPADIAFIKDDKWLSESSVIEQVVRRRGTWCIDLLFASSKDPLKFIIRKISSHPSQEKALLAASLFRRQAAKDQRGTLVLSVSDLNLNYN